MKAPPAYLYLLYLVLLCFVSAPHAAGAAQAQGNDAVYIVYMGSAASSSGTSKREHAQLLSSLIRRKEKAVVHNYRNGLLGFAARLSREEAGSIAQRPGVVSVFPDPLLHLHTTRSWDFLKYQTDVEIDSRPSTGGDRAPSDTIIGVLDTGIWPESESFRDEGMGPIPARWKGICMAGNDFNASSCNRKLIGARYYVEDDEDGDDNDLEIRASGTPRDKNGHGTHVASTAAGSPVGTASYYGLASGTAKGGAPGSRIAMYRVCTSLGCSGSSILKAFDDAIGDGVDVLSLSLGSSAGLEPEFSSDPIAIGAFHAVEKGIIVVCSAGNDGPTSRSVVNVAPWILTVAATTIDRDFESDVVLGGNKIIKVKGGGINFSALKKYPAYPLAYGSSAKLDSSITDSEARNCNPGSLDDNKVKGNIILCENSDDEYSPREKLQGIITQGGLGVILIDDDIRSVPSKYGSSPMTVVTSKDGSQVLAYINSTRNPVATILPTESLTKFRPAPMVAYFSSRGPSFSTRNLLKPDVAAPGVAILAAWPGNDTKEAIPGKEPPLFNILSGTSMSCPHVSAVAATIKSLNPSWSPAAIRSAIMTTALQTNNMKAPITTSSGSAATPYDIGAGEVSISGPLQPGLVYETETVDYLIYLCSIGYEISKIKLIASAIPSGFSCPSNSSSALISNMNYPSIAISNMGPKETKKITRIVTNVGEEESEYTLVLDKPDGIEVKVMPEKLQFSKDKKKMSYEVTFSYTPSPALVDTFGSITWTNGKYKVRSPVVISKL